MAKLDNLNVVLDKINLLPSVRGSMVLSRGGLVIAAKLPKGLHEETFAAMVATMAGAAQTACMPLGVAEPRSITVDLGASAVVAQGAGSKGLAVVVVSDPLALQNVVPALSPLCQEIKDIL